MSDNDTPIFDVAIIGGGPAGQAAALVLDAAGARIAVIDEQQRPGGQILRQPPREFTVRNWAPGAGYRDLRTQLLTFEACPGPRWIGGHSVIGIEQAEAGFVLTLSGNEGVVDVHARRLLIATGCYDLPIPIPGWTLPGAMGAGGLQALVKAQGIIPGERMVLAGTHPLMLIVADQIVAAGGGVAEIAFDQSFGRMTGLLARGAMTGLRHIGLLRDAAAAWARLRRAGVPVRFGRRLLAIEGARAVDRVRFRGSSGKEAIKDCDGVGLCYGFVPQSDLPRLAGIEVRWADPAGGWAAVHDDWMRSSVAGISVAGETTGVAGAPAARQEGTIAGAGLARDLALLNDPAAEAIRRSVAKKLERANRFAALLARIADPRPALAEQRSSDTIICRCEDVTAATIDAALEVDGDPNAVKLGTRCGMGLCQGRGCEHMLLRMAAAHAGVAPGELRGFTARFPVRPTRIGDLIR